MGPMGFASRGAPVGLTPMERARTRMRYRASLLREIYVRYTTLATLRFCRFCVEGHYLVPRHGHHGPP